VVVDNGDASFEVGDQVPVTTGSATVLSSNNAIVNTVDYVNTGVILHVQPHVNYNGSVLLDIDQLVSTVPQNNTSLTPTISQREVKSSISVVSGQTVLLAGMIQDQQQKSRAGVPILSQLPYVGAAFGTTGKSQIRTELIMFIRPTIIRDGADAAMVAEELRSKMRGGKTPGAYTALDAQRPLPTRAVDGRTAKESQSSFGAAGRCRRAPCRRRRRRCDLGKPRRRVGMERRRRRHPWPD